MMTAVIHVPHVPMFERPPSYSYFSFRRFTSLHGFHHVLAPPFFRTRASGVAAANECEYDGAIVVMHCADGSPHNEGYSFLQPLRKRWHVKEGSPTHQHQIFPTSLVSASLSERAQTPQAGAQCHTPPPIGGLAPTVFCTLEDRLKTMTADEMPPFPGHVFLDFGNQRKGNNNHGQDSHRCATQVTPHLHLFHCQQTEFPSFTGSPSRPIAKNHGGSTHEC